MAFFTTRGRENYYIEFGKGRPVLLLHGISNSGRAWAPQVPALVAAGYRVIVPDHPGHGASAPLTEPTSVAEIADDTEALLAHLGINLLDIVGLSLGGMVAMELALRHPGKVERLVVANSFERTDTEAFRAMAEGWAEIFEQPHGPITRFEQNWPQSLCAAFRETAEGLQTYQLWHGIAATTDGPSLAHVARGIAGFNLADRLSELAMPTLFIAGEEDQMSPPELSRGMANKVPQAEFQLIAEAAHISNADSAEAFTKCMLFFLARA